MIVRTAWLAAFRMAVLCALVVAPLRMAGAADAVLYRVFLLDRTTIVSYGDFVRVGDRVVVSIPVGAAGTGAPTLQLVSIPESAVDWARTEEYAYAARAKRYAETRGEADFSRLSNEVADALNQVAHTDDPARRLALAERARKVLGEWPSHNYGYRARDVAQLSAMLDEVVSELRVAAGQSRFDVSLVSSVEARVPVPLLPPPGARESIEGALEAARLAAEPAERVSLLTAVAQALQPLAAESWASALYARASAELAAEERIERAYADLSSRMLTAADQHAKRADVRSIERLIKRALETDDTLGRRRPQATAALLATLDARLDAARRLRLARDAWTVRLGLVRAYEQRIESTVASFRRSTQWLEDIRQLAGPSPSALKQLVRRIEVASRSLARIKPPAELESAHGMLSASLQMAGRAAASRQTAIRGSTSMQRAWEASSAAAGALMLFDRAHEELRRLVAPPEL
jgi:hypothetical protein